MRKRQQEQKQPPKYDERCRNLSDEERARQRGSGAAHGGPVRHPPGRQDPFF